MFGTEQHGRAQAITFIFTFEDCVVYAALTAFPKCRILGNLRIGYGLEAQLAVHFHNGCPRGNAEYFRIGVQTAGQAENPVLNTFGNT
ncbi:hypothetical protein D3C73_1339790 [compost metagenome]